MKSFEVWDEWQYVSSWDYESDANQERDRLHKKFGRDFFVKKICEEV